MSVFVSVPWEKSPDVERVVVGLGHKENARKDLHVAIWRSYRVVGLPETL